MADKEKTIFDYMLLASVDINPFSDFLNNPEADLNIEDKVGHTPLFYAIISGSMDQLLTQMILEHIIKYNKNIYDYLDLKGFDVIDMLVMRSNIRVLETFLKFGLDPNYKVDRGGNTFLHKVLSLGVVNIGLLLRYVYLFDKYNGSFTVKNNQGRSCIDIFLSKLSSSKKDSDKILYEDRFILEYESSEFDALMKFFTPIIIANRNLLSPNIVFFFRKSLPDIFSTIQTKKNLDIVSINKILDGIEN